MQLGFNFDVDPKDIIAEKMELLTDFVKAIKDKRIPDHIPDFHSMDRLVMESDMSDQTAQDLDKAMRNAKQIARENGMWALVDKQWTKRLAEELEGKKVLEVMAGAGWLAKALSEHGVDITATDNYESHMNEGSHDQVTDVENMDALAALEANSDADVVIMSWPPLDNDIAQKVGEATQGKTLVYIGEGNGGCTATDEFHENMGIDNIIPIPNFVGVHDSVHIGSYSSPDLSQTVSTEEKVKSKPMEAVSDENQVVNIESDEGSDIDIEHFTVISETRGDFTVEAKTGDVVEVDAAGEGGYTVKAFDVEEYYEHYSEYPQGVVDINDIGFHDMVDGYIEPSGKYRESIASVMEKAVSTTVPSDIKDLTIPDVVDMMPELERTQINEMIKTAASLGMRKDSAYMDMIWDELSPETQMMLGGSSPQDSASDAPLSVDDVIEMAKDAYELDGNPDQAAELLKNIKDMGQRLNAINEIGKDMGDEGQSDSFEYQMEERGVFDKGPQESVGIK